MEPIVDEDGPPHSGFVDLIDSWRGVRGWAVNHANPLHPVRLLLCVGDQPVAEAFGEGDREDISATLGRPARAGFVFDGSVMRTLPGLMDDPHAKLTVRVAATGFVLPGAADPPAIGGIVDRLNAHAVLEQPSRTADFGQMLGELRAAAGLLSAEDLLAADSGLEGYIETLAFDASGPVWFIGWMKRDHPLEFSAVAIEPQAGERRHEAAVALLHFARDDLPDDSCGIVGTIASDWRPAADVADLQLFFGMGGRFHLRAHAPLRVITAGNLLEDFENLCDRSFGTGRMVALQRMLSTVENWTLSRASAQMFAADCSIDRILLVPGMGCLVEGWAMSPIKRIDTLRLRIGTTIMHADPESLYWKPRPDLVAAFPGRERMVERAGFVGLFTGHAEPEDFTDPVLKVVFHGGSSANWSIAPAAFRRLGHSAGVEDALRFYPALQDEAFFPRFAEAAIRAERNAMNPPVAISLARSSRVMVFVLPEDRCDLFLLFEALAQQCRTGNRMAAVAFVAASKSNRSDALWLFREFQAGYGTTYDIACSLLVIDDAAQGFALLPDILRLIGAERFLFAGAGVALRDAGWARARLALAPGAADLVFFALRTGVFGRGEGLDQGRAGGAEGDETRNEAGGEISARCFAWSTADLERWIPGAASVTESFLGGFYLENGLSQDGSAWMVQHDAASCTRTPISTRVQDAINASVYAGHARARSQSRPAANA